MFKINLIVLVIGLTCLTSCKSDSNNKIEKENISKITSPTVLEKRFQKLLDYPVGATNFPRSMSLNPEVIHKVNSNDWTSGFFPGNLWLIFKLTGNNKYANRAKLWTALMENQKTNNRTHDMGFKVYCSFGEGLKIDPDNAYYKSVILESAKTLSTRYDRKVGLIRSWDFNKDVWDFPVIIDNMMNLELLFEATKISGDSTFYNIAVKHANNTLKNQFRPDGSVFHVVNYDTITGQVKTKDTHQGFNVKSSWARGQAWAIYGYTMAYRYTKDSKYLSQAEQTLKFYMEHKNLPRDGVPYWDFNDPGIPNAPRDVSAAALVSSAAFELYKFTKNKHFLNFGIKLINVLNSESYLLSETVNGPFVLDHSTGNWPKKDEIDQPIVYADYYFLEALLRQENLKS
ncbi:glycoside hydrolase family 88 protein [Algibacter pacificus]|uniref:glycoside hydrolase family 88 protein n=1 Tax=Algibacter pacificus TaxID=2599389 RepID=UPI0011C9CEC8|nr:glycoside hydrolase family 88 protein [Algibacter pacificus]